MFNSSLLSQNPTDCAACAQGDRHPAWLLSFTLQGRRRCLYVPLALVPDIRKALKNGL